MTKIADGLICYRRETWLDMLRGIAILAVVADHAFSFFPKFRDWQLAIHTFFSVNWFIFLAGYSNSISFSKINLLTIRNIIGYWYRRLSIIPPYLIASLINVYINFNKDFGITSVLSRIANFNGANHFYFIQIILQLYLVFPLAILLFRLNKNIFYHFALLLIGLLISFKFIPIYQPPWYYQNFFAPIGLGYLAAFLTGIFFFYQPIMFRTIVTLLFLPLFMILEIYSLQTWGSFMKTVPNILLYIWSISLLMIVRIIANTVIAKISIITAILSYLGRKSIFVYLFHFGVFSLLSNSKYISNFLLFLFVILFSIIISLLIEYVYSLVSYQIMLKYHRLELISKPNTLGHSGKPKAHPESYR